MLKRLMGNKFVKNNIIFFASSALVGMLNWIYHAVVGRLLGPSDYGIVASLIALVYILLIPSGVVTPVAMKFTSEFHAKEKSEQIGAFIFTISPYAFGFGLILLAGAFVLRNVIASFLRIPSSLPVVVLSLLFVISFPLQITRGTMQGLQKFFSLSVNLLSEAVLKVITATILVLAGLKAPGAIASLSIAAVIAYGLSFLPIKKFLVRTPLEVSFKRLISFSTSTSIIVIAIALFQNIDVILVKHYFDPHQAGLYASLALMGKIIFFITATIAGVMFPMVVELHAKDERHHHIVHLSLLVALGLALPILSVYLFVPKFAILVLFGEKFTSLSSYLIWFGVIGTFLSLSSILLNYFLSVEQTKFFPFLLTFALFEALLVFLLHKTLLQVIIIVILSLGLLLASLTIVYVRSLLQARHVEGVKI